MRRFVYGVVLMELSPPYMTLIIIAALLNIVPVVRLFNKGRFPFDSY